MNRATDAPVGRIVIVGASLGGVRTAQALRSAGYRGELTLVGEEDEPPYDRPPLSKAVVRGAGTAADHRLLDDAGAAGVRLLLGRCATELHVDGREVELDDGSRLPYDMAVVATGACARPSPWGSRPGVHVLRTAADAEALRRALARGGHLVIIGAGFIGAEVASSARAMGLAVSLVDTLPVPMARIAGAEVGELFTGLHARNGVDTYFGTGVRAVEPGPRVCLTSGEVLAADTVLVGIGAVPNDGWLRSSGLLVDDGLVCDEFCRAGPSVYAVGDVARWTHPRHGPVRVEHWTNAVEQAACVAHNLLDPAGQRAYEPVEYIWSDQYDWKIQIAGRPDLATRHELFGDRDRFAALYADDGGRLAGAVTVNWPRALVAARRSIGAVTDDVVAAVAVLPPPRPARAPAPEPARRPAQDRTPA